MKMGASEGTLKYVNQNEKSGLLQRVLIVILDAKFRRTKIVTPRLSSHCIIRPLSIKRRIYGKDFFLSI